MGREGTNQVECKHCGRQFAANANRIKHDHQIKGTGVEICPNPSKNIRDLKEKEHLLDSQEKGIMEKAGAGGRPKADEWEHVTLLEGKNKVKCNYCGFVFAASANRIKIHIGQIEGRGIRLCPNRRKINMDVQKEKEHLLDSQGSPVLDRAREYSMLPEITRERIKAPQQAQIHNKYMHQEKTKVGPFYVSTMVNERDIRLIQYAFQQSCEKVFSSRQRFHLPQPEFATLKPGSLLNGWVIETFVYILTHTERSKSGEAFNLYLPLMFSTEALDSNSDDNFRTFLDFVDKHNIRDNYMFGDLEYCDKIFVPIHVEKDRCGHYYLYVIHLKDEKVAIWDSRSNEFVDDTLRDEKTQKLLKAMENLFGGVIKFTKFGLKMEENILSQDNGFDCGLFVINYMQQSKNYVKQNPLFQFHSDEERLNLALKLLKSDLNEEKETLYDKVKNEENLNLYGIQREREVAKRSHTQVERGEDLALNIIKRRPRVDIYGTIFEGAERAAAMQLDDYNKRNNVGLNRECGKGYILPTTYLGGKDVQRHIQQIWEWLLKDKVSAIGIWGMAGIGKTTLATHVHNKLLEEAGDHFDYIIWITVSQSDKSICWLQKAIARSINLDMSDEECDVKRMSGKLLQASKHINKCVLILDDVWDPIFLEDVGFPVSNDRIKLILTSRSQEVCQSMNMSKTINIKPLDEEDGWDLFKRTLGIHQIQLSMVEPIARAVVEKCEGLPIAIVTIARSMRGKKRVREWNHILESGLDEMDERVFSMLKSSYVCLNNKLQRFFLYYALRAKEDVKKNDLEPLIRRFFYKGWTDETKNLEMQYNEGYTMLQKLKNNSLLIQKKGGWRVHTFLKFMALKIAKETSEIMVKSGTKLKEFPVNREWKENLYEVYLTGCNIQKILYGTAPKCSNLSTLLLNHNHNLKQIPDDFFSNMPALEILDLSETSIERLPQSVSNLECLIALLLSRCKNLRFVPSLANLQRLRELDLSFTRITEAPCGLELLVSMRCLNLAATLELAMPSSAISKSTEIRSLLNNWRPVTVSPQFLQGLTKLEFISVNFTGIKEFNAYVTGFLDKDCVLKSYHLIINFFGIFTPAFIENTFAEAYSSKRVSLINVGSLETAVLPKDVNELIISGYDNRTREGLCDDLLFCRNNNDLAKIEWLKLRKCYFLESVCCACHTCSFCFSVKLVRLTLEELVGLKQLMVPSTPSSHSPFHSLVDLHVSRCSEMKILITQNLLAHLQNLEVIIVELCGSMEEIVEENGCSGITLPKVRSVKLRSLKELTSIFRGTMLCPSLKYFKAKKCRKLSNPPDIEIEGYKLQMEKLPTGYFWKCDNQEEDEDEDEEEHEHEHEHEHEEEEEEEEQEQEEASTIDDYLI